MIFTLSFVAILVSFTQAATSDEEIPLVVATQGGSEDTKVSSLLPELDEPDVPPPLTFAQSPASRGRSDIEIEADQPSEGYFYPKPSKPFNLPTFKTLDGNVAIDQSAAFIEDTEQLERQPRSPQRRRRPYFPSPPPFIPGFIPPSQIRPLPALYGKPMRF